jgi:hypothetical protein
MGMSGSSSATFTVTPPSGGAVFATCNSTDTANIFVRDITQTGDANGNPLDSPIDITSTNPALASQIAAAFSFSPNPVIFTPGEAPVTITVAISNPGVDPSAYGVFDINFAAKDVTPGSAGIGVASGSDFVLHLIAPTNTCDDTTKPDVTITEPAGDQLLGVIPVEVTANDPDVPQGCGTGVASMSADVESALYVSSNGMMGFHQLLLDSATNTGTFDHSFTVPAGITVTGDANFTPTGGSGTNGTVSGTFFAASALSGIGSYTINAQATDGANNVGTAIKSFSVTYDVSFSQSQNVGSGGNPATKSNIHLKFTVNRSNVSPNDGAFMVDETVAVALRTATNAGSDPTDSTYSFVNYFGCGAIGSNVQIVTSTGSPCATGTNVYQTDFSGIAINTYYADVWFKDVDGTWRLEGGSGAMAPQ